MCTRPFSRRDVQAFPSGHAMSVVASWAFVVLIAAHGLRMFGKGTRTFWKVHIVLMPSVIVPIYVCGDRIRSGNHTPSQVVSGAVFGLMVAILVFSVMDRRALLS
jgi:membrane-associated phospholipid phosphatase